MTESEWTRRVCKEMEQSGAVVRSIVARKRQAPGWPDRWIGHPWWHGHLEFKGAETRLTKLQEIVIRRIVARRPGTAYVVRFPGILEDHEGVKLGDFTGGLGLLILLKRLGDEPYARSETTH